MINIQKFLLKSNLDIGAYALVTYNEKTEAVWFAKHNCEGKDWFLEFPCELFRIAELKNFIKDYLDGNMKSNVDTLSMIIDNTLYENENFKYKSYLPKEVDNIELISEKECLRYLLSKCRN